MGPRGTNGSGSGLNRNLSVRAGVTVKKETRGSGGSQNSSGRMKDREKNYDRYHFLYVLK